MQETTNYRFKKIGLDDSPPDITATNPNWDEADRILKEHEGGIETLNLSTESIYEQLGEMENKKVSYTDLTPIVTTGTDSTYTATIPANVTEITVVPHINNLAGATLNTIPILDREGAPIKAATLKANIPTKLVRVGSNFFIASGGGGNTLGLEGAYAVALGAKPTFENNYTTMYAVHYNDMLVEVGHYAKVIYVNKYSKTKKSYERIAALDVKIPWNTGSATVLTHHILFSKDGSKVYFEATITSVVHGVYELDLATLTFRTICTVSTGNTGTFPKILHADSNYIYYHIYNIYKSKDEFVKVSVNDLSLISSNVGLMNIDLGINVGGRCMFYNDSNNCIYFTSIDTMSKTMCEINLNTLTMSAKAVSSVSSFYTQAKKGIYADKNYLYTLVYPDTTAARLYKYSLTDFSVISEVISATNLSNPKEYPIGAHFLNIVFYDRNRGHLWVNTSAPYNSSYASDNQQSVLIALDLNNNNEIVDCIFLKNNGYNGGAVNTFIALSLNNSMTSSLYGDAVIICDYSSGLYYQIVI